MNILEADIVFTHGNGVTARLIRWFSSSRHKKASWANHVGIVSKRGHVGRNMNSRYHPVVIEALVGPGVVERAWSPTGIIAIARPTNLSLDRRLAIVEAARDYVGDKYTESTLLIHLLRLDRVLAKIFGRRWRICSWLVGVAYAKEGLLFGQEEAALDPDEIFDFVSKEHRTLAGKYRWVIFPS